VPPTHSSTLPVPADDLVQQFLPLVGHVVRGMMARVPAHVSREDLTSAGMVALVQAARGFDPERGVSFAGYATTRIRGAIVDELRGLDWASRSVRRRSREVEATRAELTATLGRTATDAELASALGIGPAELAAHQDDVARAGVVSLNGFADGAADDLLPSGGPSPAETLEQRERIAYLRDAVEQLPERLRIVVEGYFFGERPMAEIAERLGVTESRISQLRAEAVTLLRGALNSALDPDRNDAPARPAGCAARRKEAYYAAVASHRTYAARLSTPFDSPLDESRPA